MKPYTTIAQMREDALKMLSRKPSLLERIQGKTHSGLDMYLEGGAGTGQTVRNNEHAFGENQIAPRFISQKLAPECRNIPGMKDRDCSDADLFVAPTAWHKLFHPDGECATSRAVAKGNNEGVGFMIASSFSQTPLHEILCKKWYQMMVTKQEGVMERMIKNAEDKGAQALVITVDTPNGCTACRNISDAPDRVPLYDMPLLPSSNMFTGNTLRKYIEHHMPQNSEIFSDRVRYIIEKSPLPVYLKGIMTPEDAEEAIKIGAAGIYVSNHGGRQYDRGMSTLKAVKRIRDKIGGDFPLIMDGGIRTGQDIVIARRAGADLVGIGRPIHYGLTVGGQKGVEKVFEILRSEQNEALHLGI